MKALCRRLLTVTLCLSAYGAAPLAVATSSDQSVAAYKPKVGQEGKDVVWVPTSEALVNQMLDMAGVTPQDYLVDLGSGDGRTVITAAKRGAKAKGIEFNPDLVQYAQAAAKAEGVSDRATFEQADIFQSDFSDATVVTLFLTTSLNLKLRPILLDMKPGTRVVSNSFNMGDWEPDESARLDKDDGCVSWCNAYKWIVPAKVGGAWDLGGRELVLDQSYQTFTGALQASNNATNVTNGKLRGKQIEFSVGNDLYVGQVEGNRMQGTVNGKTPWQAVRKAH